MNTDAVDRRTKLREPIDRLLLAAPVERTCPVVDERAQLAVFGSERPAILDLISPASAREPLLKILQCALRHVDEEPIVTHPCVPTSSRHGSEAIACESRACLQPFAGTRLLLRVVLPARTLGVPEVRATRAGPARTAQ